MQNPACPLCQQNQCVIKSGRNRTSTQRYGCQQCQGYFTPQPKPMGYDPQIKKQAVQLYLEGTSYRAIGRLFSVDNQSVINWVEDAQKVLPAQIQKSGGPTDTSFAPTGPARRYWRKQFRHLSD